MIIILLFSISGKIWAGRKGPIFEMEIPAQRELLKKYFEFNSLEAPALFSRTAFYDNFYTVLAENKESANSFDLFKSREFRHTPNLDFSLAFENHNMGFENPEKKNDQYGYCLGVTTVLRKMNLLAFFDPEKKAVSQADYEKLIDLVMENKPVIIPHFSNLHEFSSTPGIKEYMVKHVLDQWARKNATIYSAIVQMLLGTKRKYSKAEAHKLYGKLKARLDRHYPPRVFLSKKNYEGKLLGPQYIHVMQVFSLSELNDDGSYKIGVWHINKTWDKATYFIEVRADGSAWLETRDLGELDIVPGDDAQIAEMIKYLKPFCLHHQELCR